MTFTITDLARRIDDLVAEDSLTKRMELGRALRLDVARELDSVTVAIRSQRNAGLPTQDHTPLPETP